MKFFSVFFGPYPGGGVRRLVQKTIFFRFFLRAPLNSAASDASDKYHFCGRNVKGQGCCMDVITFTSVFELFFLSCNIRISWEPRYQNTPKKSQQYLQDITHISQRNAQDIQNISPRNSQDIPKIWSGLVWSVWKGFYSLEHSNLNISRPNGTGYLNQMTAGRW